MFNSFDSNAQCNPSITVTVTTQNLRCNGDNSGSISVSIVGGVPSTGNNYNYSLFSGIISPIIVNNYPLNNYSFTNLPAFGSYLLVVQVPLAGGGFTVCPTAISLTEPPPLSISIGSITNASCNGSSDGAIDAVVSGGPTAPYTYSWSNGATTEDISGLTAGDYILTITDGNGCTLSKTFTVTEPSPIVATSAISNVSCLGGSDGAIDISISGGSLPYASTVWNNGATTEDISGLIAGSYSVLITDNNNCKKTLNFTITQPASTISITNTITNINCNGTATGSINITPSGGTAPYTYLWTNGITSKDLTAVVAGSYSVTIMDSKGCSNVFGPFIITQTPAITLTTAPTITNINCNGASTGAIVINPTGGTTPYTYAWTNGATTQNISGLSAGSYSITITDNNGCPKTFGPFIITEPTPIAATPTINNVTCNGTATGSITISTGGGTAPYTYVWSNGATTQNISGIIAGSYSVTITDNNGCPKPFGPFIITQPVPITATGTVVNTNCNGGATGSITITTPTGGTAPFTYAWSNGVTTQNISGLIAGSYSVTITDNNGCSSTLPAFTITQPTVITATNFITNITCNGTATGAINITPSGGTAPYTYLWTNGITSKDLTAVVAGSYSATIMDSKGCSNVFGPFTITQTSAITLTTAPTITNINCNGASTGAIVINPTGGTTPYTYAWTNGATTQNISGLSAGSYSITITDNNGCPKTFGPFIITEPTPIAATPTINNVTCNGTATGSITISTGGGTAPYTYVWSNGATTQNISGIIAGSYSVTITDNNGCPKPFGPFIITQPVPITATGTVVNTNCNGGATGSITITTPTGGTAPFTYAWSNGVTTQNISGLIAGSYSVTITDNNGCSSTLPAFTITQPTVITATNSITNITCNGTATGAINITPTGGTAPYTYLWTNGITSKDLTAVVAGSYSVTIMDSKGCSNVFGPFTITQTPAITLTTAPTITNINCNGASTGAIVINPTGGTTPYTYAWTNGATTQNISGLSAGSYSITITDNNGCPKTFGPFIITEPTPIAATPTINNVTCNGTATGSITISTGGGTAPYTYVWSNGATTQNISGIIAGSYSVTITDNNGCPKPFGPFIITQPVPITATGTVVNTNCNGGATGSITITTPTGGTAPFTYAWSNGVTTQNISGLIAGSYSVTITDSKGCSRTLPTFIINQPSAISSTGAQTNILCNGSSTGSINLTSATGGVGPYTYLWTNGATTQNLINIPAGNYSVVIKDASGCTFSLSFVITEPSPILANATTADATCSGTATGSISITNPTGGTAPYIYVWSNGATTQNLLNVVAGSYSLTITDSKGCQKSLGPFTITEPSSISSTGTIIDPTCNGSATGSISLSNPTGGIAPYTFAWSNGSTSKNLTNVVAGNYIVTITDKNGCSNSSMLSFTLNNGTAITGSASATPSVVCSGGSTLISAVIDPAYTPANNAYSFDGGVSFQNSSNFPIAKIVGDTTVTVILKDINGCLSNPILVTISTNKIIGSLDITQAISCFGANDGELTMNIVGSSVGYTYSINGSSFQPSNAFSNLSKGTYIVVIDDGTACLASYKIVLKEPSLLTIGIKAIIDNDPCQAINNGSIAVTTSGGNSGKLFTITPSGLSQSDSTFTNLSGNTYTITVEDSKGCSANINATINQPTPISIVSTNTPIDCINPLSGSIDVTVSGGIAPFTYLWSTGNLTEDLTNLVAGTYKIIVTDSKNCKDSLTIILNNAPSVTGIANATPAIVCSGQGTIISATIDPAFIAATNAYSFDEGLTFQASSSFAISNILGDTSINIILKDINGCISNPIIVAIATSKIDATISESQAISCKAGNNGELTVNVVGSSTGFTYSINGGAFQTLPIFSNLTAGSYTIIIDDGTACKSSYPVSLLDPLPLTTNIKNIVDVAPCSGGNNGSISLTTNGGSKIYNYTITPSGITQTDSTFRNLTAGNYSITATDAKGCSATATATIIQPSGIDTSLITKAIINNICAGNNNGSIQITNVTGGISPYTYTLNGSTNTTGFFNKLLSGTDTITITDASGCPTLYLFRITEPLPILFATNIISSSCTRPDGSIEIINVTGGTPAYKYSINDGTTYSNTTLFTALSSGSYPVRVGDQNGCSYAYSVILPIKKAPIPYIRIHEPLCNGGSNGFVVIDSISGGVPLFQYNFNDINVGSSTVYSNLTAGQYPLIITDKACTYNIDSFFVYNKTTLLYDTIAADRITVGEPAAITASTFSINADRYESSGLAGIYNIAGGTPGYLWSSDNTLFKPVKKDTILLNHLSRGNHTVYIVDTNGCRGTFDILIYVEFFIPNLITPNKDGKNDRFEIMALPVGSELLIVNRWGNRVYLSSNYDNSWDADEDADGIYYYELQLPNGEKHKGWLEVVR